MPDAYTELIEKFKQLSRLEHALTFLQWDQLVMMPPAGNDSRANAIAELTAMHHDLLTAPEMSKIIGEARQHPLGPAEQRSVTEMERTLRRAACLPSSLVKAQSLAGSKCEHGWRRQRQENDWPGFLQNFREVVRLSREEAQLRQDVAAESFATPYDALLDLHCTGDSSEFIASVFSRLKSELPPLLEKVQQSQPHQPPLVGNYPTEKQKELNEKLMASLGFNFEAGRLDVSMHPFSTGDRGDQRITTRFRKNDFGDALQSTAHETGHASYEAGLPDKWDGLPVGKARNLCIHESQSLFFEKQIFLSRPFLAFFTPTVHEYLPESKQFSSEHIWRAQIQVKPSLIRTEADEVTYPLHVILRFEIEKELINGNVEADDIPELWDQKMQQYLGISTTGNFRDGCLQDIHWTDGSFGYFPSYTLGAINAAQLANTIRKANPNWQETLTRGDITFLREWLREHIWSKGSTMDSQEIITAATGEGTNAQYFLDHITARYMDHSY